MSKINNLIITLSNNKVENHFKRLKFEQALGCGDLREAGGQYLTDDEFNKLILPKK